MDKQSFLFRISLSATCLFTIITQDPWIVAPTKAAEIKSGGEVSKSYILGPGDTVQIELFEIPELSGNFSIGPDGTIYLPRLRSLSVDGLTVDELRYFLTEQYKAFVKDPLVYIRPISYRPVRVYVGGEITRPGYYMLSGGQILADKNNIQEQSNPVITRNNNQTVRSLLSGTLRARLSTSDDVIRFGGDTDVSSVRWPTLFDALRAAQGVTAYSDLSQVQITRKQPLGVGGGKVRAKVDFLQLVRGGDESVNIRLFDGDVISVSRSPKVLREQLLEASRTNLSPDFIEVFVSGRVKEPGPQSLPQGATLNQAIASAGGPRLLRGGVEFLRFNPDGSTDRRQFSYNSSAGTNDYKNPVVNLAAQAGVRYSIENPAAYIQSNLVGFGHILEGCRHHSIENLLYASSSSVYGGNTQMPFSESQNVDHPVSLYAASKKANELMAHTYSHLYGLSATGLRFFTVYGPWGRPDMALFLFTKAILEKRPIKVFNHGEMLRDFTYVDDIIESMVRLLLKPAVPDITFDTKNPTPAKSWAPHQVFNIGNSHPVPLLEYINSIEQALGIQAKKEYLPMQPGDVPATSADTTKLRNWIDFTPNTTVQNGVKRFVEWYRSYYGV